MIRSASASTFLAILFAMLMGTTALGEPAKGPLRVHPRNPRYFTDGTGKAVYLTGAHTWNILPDMSTISKTARTGGPPLSRMDFQKHRPKPLDYAAYLDYMEGFHHNFIRMWAWGLENVNDANGKVTVDLTEVKEKLVVEWFDPHTRKKKDGGKVDGGAKRSFSSPFGKDASAVLYLRRS